MQLARECQIHKGEIMSDFIYSVILAVSPVVINTLELLGILIIVYGSIKALIRLFRVGFSLSDPTAKIMLGETFAIALEFKLGAEIIKTVIVHSVEELIVLGVVVFLRIIMTYVIHWEVEQAGGAHVVERKKEH